MEQVEYTMSIEELVKLEASAEGRKHAVRNRLKQRGFNMRQPIKQSKDPRTHAATFTQEKVLPIESCSN